MRELMRFFLNGLRLMARCIPALSCLAVWVPQRETMTWASGNCWLLRLPEGMETLAGASPTSIHCVDRSQRPWYQTGQETELRSCHFELPVADLQINISFYFEPLQLCRACVYVSVCVCVYVCVCTISLGNIQYEMSGTPWTVQWSVWKSWHFMGKSKRTKFLLSLMDLLTPSPTHSICNFLPASFIKYQINSFLFVCQQWIQSPSHSEVELVARRDHGHSLSLSHQLDIGEDFVACD